MPPANPMQRPKVLVIMSDQHLADAMSCEGHAVEVNNLSGTPDGQGVARRLNALLLEWEAMTPDEGYVANQNLTRSHDK